VKMEMGCGCPWLLLDTELSVWKGVSLRRSSTGPVFEKCPRLGEWEAKRGNGQDWVQLEARACYLTATLAAFVGWAQPHVSTLYSPGTLLHRSPLFHCSAMWVRFTSQRAGKACQGVVPESLKG